jgi:ferredoxin-NADP reductase
MTSTSTLRVRVHAITWQSPSVRSVVLASLDGQPLPPAAPGAHIDVHLAKQLSRSYSIVGQAGNGARYEIAVAKDAASRGGSRHVHEKLQVGDEIDIGAPRNLFPLHEDAAATVLIAGGIGITPLWSMAQRLDQLGRRWVLHYAARSRRHAAYLADIEALAARSPHGRLHLHFDDEQGGACFDMAGAVAAAPADAHLYCCGPQPMLAAYEQAAAARPAERVHLERFGAAPGADGDGDSFDVTLSRSGLQFNVPAGQSILDVLLENGMDPSYGCMQGSCGLCETRVLDGTPDHRDNLLSADAKAGNACMLICCSRSKTPSLTLDL